MTLPSDELTPIWRLRHFGEKTAWKLARCTYSKAALFQLPFGLLFGRVSYDIEDSATRALTREEESVMSIPGRHEV
jgi:hypothetical protein